MKDYNGFSGAERAEAQRWLNMMIATGKLVKAEQCCACGQMKGVIDLHAEDYSKPFAQGKTDQFPLCFSCHMAVHCRFRNISMWDRYRENIGLGWRLPPIFTRNFPLFIERFTSSTAVFTHLMQAGTDGAAGVLQPAYRPLDIIDGWLLANTGKGWR